MRNYRPLYGNPAAVDVPPGFEGHEDAWNILSTQLGLVPTDVMLPSPSVDVNALMTLVDQYETRKLTEAQFVDSAAALVAQFGVGNTTSPNLGFKEVPSVLKNLVDADDAWAAISQNLNLTVEQFERALNVNYAALLVLLAQQYLTEEITEAKFVAEVRRLLDLGELVSQPLGSTPGVIPTEFAVSKLDFAWELLEREGITIAQWNAYDNRTKDLILAKAAIFMSRVPVTESGILNYLDYALGKMRAADLAMFTEEGVFDVTTQPEFVGPPAPPEMQLALRGVIETALNFEFRDQPEITRHDIYSFLEDICLNIQTAGGRVFDVPSMQNVIRYFRFLGFPDYRPTELAAIASLINAGRTDILDAERTAMAIDNNRPDALSQPINLKIVLAAFGQKSYEALKKFCAQSAIQRSSDIVDFYENDIALLLGVDNVAFNKFLLANFDARISGQLIDEGSTVESRLGQEEARRAAEVTRKAVADQAAAIRTPTSRTQSYQTSGARFASGRGSYSALKASIVLGGFAIGIGYLSHKIWRERN